MSTPKKSHDAIRQNGQVVQKSLKHDANLQKNSTLYFQVGLIVCLLAAYGLLEMKFQKLENGVVSMIPPDEDVRLESDVIFEIYEEVAKKEEVKQNRTLSYLPPVITETDPPSDAPEFLTELPASDAPPLNPNDLSPLDQPEEPVEVDFVKVEQVPIFPGCENKKTNDELKKCMSDKITRLVQKHYDANLASELGLSGKQVIQIQFKIDKTGHVTDIKSRASHQRLKQEAERVINKIPEMQPGKQRNKPVSVIYSLPIVFQVQ